MLIGIGPVATKAFKITGVPAVQSTRGIFFTALQGEFRPDARLCAS